MNKEFLYQNFFLKKEVLVGITQNFLKEKDLEEEWVKKGILEIKNSIAFIKVSGVLTGENYNSWGITYMGEIKEKIDEAIKRGCSDLVLLINSPGGTVQGTADLSNYIREISNRINTYAYVDGMMCSGAYWIGTSCTKIYANQTAEVGSIGVVTSIIDLVEFYENIGIKIKDVTNRKSPDKRIDYFSEYGEKKLKDVLDDLAEVFFSEISKNRKVEKKQVIENFGKGDVFVGRELVKRNMVDGIIEGIEELKKIILKVKKMEEKKQDAQVEASEKKPTNYANLEEVEKIRKEAKEEGRKEERNRVMAILSLEGENEDVEKTILDGVSFFVAKKILTEKNLAIMKKERNGVIPTTDQTESLSEEEMVEKILARIKKK